MLRRKPDGAHKPLKCIFPPPPPCISTTQRLVGLPQPTSRSGGAEPLPVESTLAKSLRGPLVTASALPMLMWPQELSRTVATHPSASSHLSSNRCHCTPAHCITGLRVLTLWAGVVADTETRRNRFLLLPEITQVDRTIEFALGKRTIYLAS